MSKMSDLPTLSDLESVTDPTDLNSEQQHLIAKKTILVADDDLDFREMPAARCKQIKEQ